MCSDAASRRSTISQTCEMLSCPGDTAIVAFLHAPLAWREEGSQRGSRKKDRKFTNFDDNGAPLETMRSNLGTLFFHRYHVFGRAFSLPSFFPRCVARRAIESRRQRVDCQARDRQARSFGFVPKGAPPLCGGPPALVDDFSDFRRQIRAPRTCRLYRTSDMNGGIGLADDVGHALLT